MQSIYFFRDADAELFPRVMTVGLEIPDNEPLLFDFVPLAANFRTTPELVDRLNEIFVEVFAVTDSSNGIYSPAVPAREEPALHGSCFDLHLQFVPRTNPDEATDPQSVLEKETAHTAQIEEIVALIRDRQHKVEEARLACARGKDTKYRIAVLGRARKALAPIAEALRDAGIPFRAVELEQLKDRPEVLDVLSLGRALLNPQNRVAWLGVLRAPWCGLALDDLHKLVSGDDEKILDRTVPELLAERLSLLSEEGHGAVRRVLDAIESVLDLRGALPTASLGTWLQQVWLSLGGARCVDPTARANLDLLWSCLDHLPDGEQDLLGPGLDTALEKLTALARPRCKRRSWRAVDDNSQIQRP